VNTDESRSVRSPWVWRGFLFMSLIALGFVITLVQAHDTLYAAAWGLITLGWFATSMWLWRKHTRYDDAAWQAEQSRQSRQSRQRGGKGPGRVVRGGHVA
jgi:hypothetical protein